MPESYLDPYCGPAPIPATLLARWNFDPLILVAMLALAAAWLQWGRRDASGRMALSGSLALIAVAFISPLCALASALFSARVFHHIVLIAGIAPLLAIALPWRAGPLLPLSGLVILHAVTVWLWHAPDPYLWALSHDAAYWAMQLTLGGSAYLLWREVLSPLTKQGRGIMALLATIMQMGFLGALLVFAPQPVYLAHLGTTQPFGLSPLGDQQLAGLLMWVPAAAPYIAVALWRLSALVFPRARAA
ncbi:cytochrome c oxidase assembly protein [Pelagibacterium sediminicola]|uniref:cytochrome c oxidase assembly protein n=1 Tax=Pelagibacterium sediminicola TaxID=2248761 RepID=UPI000E31AEF5|nr:cytochrome c oxidase assembly protein [Pelagibacterium sediminicola]